MFSNTASIASHDPGFARKYLEEKATILAEMQDLDVSVRDILMESLREAQTDLK